MPADSDTPGTATGAEGTSACGGSADSLDGALKVITGPTGCAGAVNTFWSKELGDAWTEPRYVAYRDGAVPDNACGAEDPEPDSFASNAFYCRLDDTIAYSSDFLGALYEKGGPTYPMFVLMHEVGHRAAAKADRTAEVSRSEENQADCLAGAEAKFTHDAGRLSLLPDVVTGAALFFQLGDAGGTWFSNEASGEPDAHGGPGQRAAAFGLGYLQGTDECWEIGASPDGTLPDFSIPSLTDILDRIGG